MPDRPQELPPQHQEKQPGEEAPMDPQPQETFPGYRGSGKLEGRRALITGGDSGIGRATAILFAREGADVAIVYLDEHEDADATKGLVEAEGQRCLTIAGDVGEQAFCREAVQRAVDELGGLDVLVNHAGIQYVKQELEEISEEQLTKTFRVNVYAQFFMTQAALEHLGEGSAIINTTSITAFKGKSTLIDYAATKGAVLSFTRSLSQSLAERGIRVNAVAPGPVWTPLIPASFPAEAVEEFGQSTPMGRPGQPEEIAPAYVYLAAEDSSYVTGQTIHVNGGQIVGG